MSDLVHINGWSLAVSGDGEPMVRDLDLAERLGFSRPAKIRDLIARLIRGGIINDSEFFTTVVKNGEKGRPANEYHLSETASMIVITRSDAPMAQVATREMVAVFRDFLRRRLASCQVETEVDMVRRLAGRGPLRKNPALSRRVSRDLGSLARNRGRHWQYAHGLFRRHFEMPSYKCLRIESLPDFDEWLRFEQTRALKSSPAIRALPQTTQTTIFDLIGSNR